MHDFKDFTDIFQLRFFFMGGGRGGGDGVLDYFHTIPWPLGPSSYQS